MIATAALPMASTSTDVDTHRCKMRQSIYETRPSVMAPIAFFVSWQGVLTLAYSGFSPELSSLKQRLAFSFAATLPKENPGSLWPKTSLAALQLKCRLSPSQLQSLQLICKECSAPLLDLASEYRLSITSLSLVIFQNRCLAERMFCQTFILTPPNVVPGVGTAASGGELGSSPLSNLSALDESHPTPEDAATVTKVLAEADSPSYWFDASKDGNRSDHYELPASGITLAHFLQVDNPSVHVRLLDAVRSFRKRVQEELPSMYSFFPEDSLHITVRALG